MLLIPEVHYVCLLSINLAICRKYFNNYTIDGTIIQKNTFPRQQVLPAVPVERYCFLYFAPSSQPVSPHYPNRYNTDWHTATALHLSHSQGDKPTYL